MIFGVPAGRCFFCCDRCLGTVTTPGSAQAELAGVSSMLRYATFRFRFAVLRFAFALLSLCFRVASNSNLKSITTRFRQTTRRVRIPTRRRVGGSAQLWSSWSSSPLVSCSRRCLSWLVQRPPPDSRRLCANQRPPLYS